jgi:hypothetical protein
MSYSSADDIEKRLTVMALDLEQQKEAYESQRTMNQYHMDEMVHSFNRLQDEWTQLSAQYKYYQMLRDYVENLANLLDVKVSRIDNNMKKRKI